MSRLGANQLWIPRPFWGLLAVAFLAGIAGAPQGARAQSSADALVIVERAGCTWCETWHQVIGPIYPKSEEGHRFPLRRVSLDDVTPETRGFREDVRYTPTFILIRCGKEAGRILGYPGEASFWGLLATLIKNSESSAACAG
ncbi:MAG: thioredoxin family protein [Deltaproteobacteria bacterium]|nr:thioredoxin family protein [Deltaproteobacteria bacterium]